MSGKNKHVFNRLVETGDEFLNKVIPPRAEDISKVISPNYGWIIVPCGDMVLNMLDLSTQVPAVRLYNCHGGEYLLGEGDYTS